MFCTRHWRDKTLLESPEASCRDAARPLCVCAFSPWAATAAVTFCVPEPAFPSSLFCTNTKGLCSQRQPLKTCHEAHLAATQRFLWGPFLLCCTFGFAAPPPCVGLQRGVCSVRQLGPDNFFCVFLDVCVALPASGTWFAFS